MYIQQHAAGKVRKTQWNYYIGTGDTYREGKGRDREEGTNMLFGHSDETQVLQFAESLQLLA